MKALIKEKRLSNLFATNSSIREFFLSSQRIWYFLSVGLTIAALISVLVIPENNPPLIYIRYFLGSIFLFLIPGYCFMRVVFIKRSFSKAVTILLSIPTSLVWVFIISLIVNFLPGRITTSSVITALSIFAIGCATIAIILEQKKHED
jgi:uncharacterized membrane protein